MARRSTRQTGFGRLRDLSEPNPRADRLQRRFSRISARLDRGQRRKRSLRVATRLTVVLLVPIAAYIWIALLSPWPAIDTVRHILSAPNCDTARSLGVAPARTGEPGYWNKHDRDNDGIACEPWPR